MAAAAPGAAEDASRSNSKGGGAGKIAVVISALNLLITAGTLGLLLVSFQKEKKASVKDISTQNEGEGEKAKEGESSEHGEGGHEKEAQKKASPLTRTINLDQFTINLATPEGSSSKYVRVNVSLEVLTEDTETEIAAKMPHVKNAIIDLVNSKRVADLATVDGRESLKEEIKNALNGFLVSGKVKGVFFTNFALAG